MPQLNEALVDTTIGTIFFQIFGEDVTTVLEYSDDGILAYARIAQVL